jgi:hypothetical protein
VLLIASCAVPTVLPPTVAQSADHLRIMAIAPGYSGAAPSDDRWTIYLDGFIDAEAARRLAAVIEREQIASAAVYFNSPGGSLVTAMAMGRLLREHGYDTDVGTRADAVGWPKAGVCYSACPFAFAGGVRRSLRSGSVLGVHRAENSVPVPDELAFQHVVSSQATEFLTQMGVSTELLAIMAQVPHDSIRLLTLEEARQFKLSNGWVTR